MTTHFMRSYSLLAIKTCHRRQIHAVGGMSAFFVTWCGIALALWANARRARPR